MARAEGLKRALRLIHEIVLPNLRKLNVGLRGPDDTRNARKRHVHPRDHQIFPGRASQHGSARGDCVCRTDIEDNGDVGSQALHFGYVADIAPDNNVPEAPPIS